MGRSRQARLARLAKQAVETPQTPHTLEEDLLVAEGVLLTDEVIPIEEVTSVPVEQLMPTEEIPLVSHMVPVQQRLRSPQNILDSIVALLFQQHHQQIYQHMVDLESQIISEHKALAEKNKIDNLPKAG